MIEKLQEKKAFVTSFDPIASTNALKFFPNLAIASTLYEVFRECDAIVIATPWSLFTQIDWKKVKEVSKASVVFDTRNILDRKEIEQAGFFYIGIGKRG
jgi:UDPglucose 6-dehydrogenase